MSFGLESQLTPVVTRWLEAQNLVLKREFSTPWGVCDLVALHLDARRVRQRLTLGQTKPIGPPLRIELLHRIPDESSGTYVTLDRLEREFANVLDRQSLLSELAHLRSARFLKTPKRGAVQKMNGWAPLHRRIVAVELKLSRVQEAIAQAAAHLKFATESYVALPHTVARRIAASQRREAFAASGLGLLAVYDSKCITLIRSVAQPQAHDAVLQMHCVERFWRTRKTAYRTT